MTDLREEGMQEVTRVQRWTLEGQPIGHAVPTELVKGRELSPGEIIEVVPLTLLEEALEAMDQLVTNPPAKPIKFLRDESRRIRSKLETNPQPSESE